jgi:hypothetical protein
MKKTYKVSGNYDAALLKTYLDSLDSMPRTASVTTSAIFSCVWMLNITLHQKLDTRVLALVKHGYNELT